MSGTEAGTANMEKQQNGPKHYVVFLGRVKQVQETSPVKASVILHQGCATPVEQFVLEALVGESGAVDHEFQPDQDVHLDREHRKHFRAVPTGGGRA